MPRVRREADPWMRYRGLIIERMYVYDLDRTRLAQRLGTSRQTVSNYLEDPGLMRMDTARKLHRVLGIEADEARAALPMW